MCNKLLNKFKDQILHEFNDNEIFNVEDLFDVWNFHEGKDIIVVNLGDRDTYNNHICVLNKNGKNENFNINDNVFDDSEEANAFFELMIKE